MDISNNLIQAGVRMAGETVLPGELETIKNLLLKGVLEDESGSVTITPRGDLEIRPRDSSLYVRGSAGIDPSIYVGYQSRKPEFVGRPPEYALDEALRKFSQAY